MQLSIPTTIAAILPLLATMLSSWLADDHLAPGINALIALVAILATATACELLANGIIPGNPAASFVGVAGYVGVLMAGDLGVLYQYLVAKPGPLVRSVPPANANPVRVPVAITLPPSQPPQGGAASVPVPPSTPGEQAK